MMSDKKGIRINSGVLPFMTLRFPMEFRMVGFQLFHGRDVFPYASDMPLFVVVHLPECL